MFDKHYMSRAETRAMALDHPIGDATGGAAYGERNDPLTAGVAVGGSVLGGLMGSRAAKNAANAQGYAADRATQLSYDLDDRARKDAQPWTQAGGDAVRTLRDMVIGGEFSKPLSVGDVTQEPGYQFGMDQGMTGASRALGKLYGYDSGATLKGLARFATDYGSTKYNDAFNRLNTDRGFRYNSLAGLAGAGQQAVGQVGSAGSNAATNAGNLTTSGGAARAAGVVGGANAWGNALTGAGNSMLQYQMFNKLFPQKAAPGTSEFFP